MNIEMTRVMREKRANCAIILSVLVCCGILACTESALASEQAITWAWGHAVTLPGSEYEKATYEEFPKKVLEATNGRLIIKPIMGVYDAGKVLFDVRDGRCEGATFLNSYFGATLPTLTFANLPGLVFTYDEHQKAYNAAKTVFNKVLQDAGTVPLFYVPFSDVLINTKRPIKKIADFKGMKMRVAALTTGQLLESMGASTMTLPAAEVYMAAQRGVIDGFDMSISAHLSLKLYEVAPYTNIVPIGQPAGTLVANKKAFNSLPKDIQNVLVRVGLELQKGFWDRLEQESKTKLVKMQVRGMILTEMPPAEIAKVYELAKPIQDKWAQLPGPDAGVRKELLETIKKAIGR